MSTLEPLRYHHEVVAALRREEPGLWDWFASDEVEEAFAERVRLDLLKSTVRLDRAQHGELHAAADAAKEAFELDVEVTFYQAAPGVEAGRTQPGVYRIRPMWNFAIRLPRRGDWEPELGGWM